jgi:uncharacterized membrane protein YqjE
MPDDPTMDEPASQLAKQAIEEARILVKLEVALAKNELKEEMSELKLSGVAFGGAAVSAILMLSMVCLAIVLALGARWWVALIGAAIWLVVALAMALVGRSSLPKQPLERTRQRLSTDLKQLKERVA